MAADQKRRRVLLGALVVVAVLTMAAHVGEVFEEAELLTVDARFGLRGPQQPSDDLLIVGVDTITLDGLGQAWPFDLSVWTDTVRELTRAGATGIVFNVPFGGSDQAHAEEFLAALQTAPPVTLGTVQNGPDGDPVVLGGPPALALPGIRAADARFDPDDDGVVRRFDHTLSPSEDDDDEDDGEQRVEGLGLPTLAVVAAEQALGRELTADAIGAEGATVNHPGPAGTFKHLSLLTVLEGGLPADAVTGRIAVIGPTAPQLLDLHPTPLAERASGAEIHASAIATVMDAFPLSTPDTTAQFILILLVCLAPLLTTRVSAGAGGFILLAIVGLYLVAAQLAFSLGLIVPVVAPLTGLALAAVAVTGVNFTFERHARRRVREVFARYVPTDVVDELIEGGTSADEDLLRAKNRDVTVLFSDLRGFTTYSEGRDAADVMVLLNDYLGAMSDVIHDAGGTVMGYLGDGIIAVFGAAEDAAGHADDALAAAVGMLAGMNDFNNEHAAELGGHRFRMGVGLNSGIVTAGNLGTVRRLAYTVIGDTVNTASRIESLTKTSPFDLLFAQSTKAALTAVPDDLVEHDTVEIRGRSQAETLWSVQRAARDRHPA